MPKAASTKLTVHNSITLLVIMSVFHGSNPHLTWESTPYQFSQYVQFSTWSHTTMCEYDQLACYRATLCLQRGLCCRPVSVCPSVTLVYCIHTAEDIVKLLSRPGSPVVLVSWPQAPVSNSKGTPSAGEQNTRGGKILRFSTEIAVYLGKVRDRPMIAMKL